MNPNNPYQQNPYAPQGYAGGGMPLKPGRGGMILTFGILGLMMCFIFGIVAWSMGKADLAEMEAGRMDPNDQGMTKAGYICGMISCILVVASFAMAILFFVVFGGLSALSS